jgi:hypothetical protein
VTRLSPCAVEHASDVVDDGEVGEERDEVRQLCVVRVVEPRRDRDRVIRMEDVRRRRVVDDDRIANRPAQL